MLAVTIGVFGLFHPEELEVKPARGAVLSVVSDAGSRMVEGSAGVRLRSAAKVTGRDGAETWFVLSVPGRIRREFHGKLSVMKAGGELEAMVEMDLETAVASV